MESFPPRIGNGLQHMSESLFVGMCQMVGTSKQVAIRRETADIEDMLRRQVITNKEVMEMLSGSHREGFRLKGSDLDYMYWPNDHRVIIDICMSQYCIRANTTLILSDSSESPPGFALLELLTPSRDRNVQLACVTMNDRVYISSSTYRQLTCQAIFPNSVENGPCGSGCIAETLEYDTAWSFVSDYWPPSASSWIDRCHSWPGPEVVDDIIRNGFHFVAIGHPLGPHTNEEWRISFSQAEYKVVNSMNHCQFLTYGLLKLFLKEVMNQQSEDTKKLLCSYHMKTTVFWAIQQNTLPLSYWCPQNLLAGFWVCFKLLLKWVYEGVCPNFFIPQNNLFLTKIHGPAQNRLFLQLHELYKKGLVCLLQSSSIRSCIIDVLYNPTLSIYTDESTLRSQVDYDVELVREASIVSIHTTNLFSLIKAKHTIEQLVYSPLTPYQAVTIRTFTATFFQYTAFQLQNLYTNTGCNKQLYIADKMSCQILKLAAKFGCVSDMLYIAMYYYKTLRYREALSVLEMTKVKLAQPYLMYMGVVDREMYTEALGGHSWSTKMRQAVANDLKLNNSICYISDLLLEQQSALHDTTELFIPMFVMLHFLEFLCYRHVDTTLSQAALDELQVLVHHDQGQFVDDIYRDISWEILGICQQITGNLRAALYSYKQSLMQYPYNNIQNATHRRIQDILSHQ